MADSSLQTLIDGVLALDPDAPAVEFEGAWINWGVLAAGKAVIAALVDAAGLGEGARVGILLRNRPEFIGPVLDVVARHRCLVTLNPYLPDSVLAADLASVEAPVLILNDTDWDRPAVRDAAVASAARCIVVSLDGARVAAGGDSRRWTRTNAPAIGVEMLTSGTTGAPKRIPLPMNNFHSRVLGYNSNYERPGAGGPALRSGVQILNTPFSHIGGLGRLLMAVTGGRKMVLLEKFKLDSFLEALRTYRPRVTSGPPTVVKMILDADTPREDLASLAAFRTGSAPLDPALAQAFFDRYGIPVLQNYGATEFGGGVAGWSMDDFRQFGAVKQGAVGRIEKGFEARIVDAESGETLAPGGEGLLELRNDDVNDGQWVRTTDLAVLDEDQFLWIKGRADMAIIRGGFKILPDTIIAALEKHPAVREATAFAVAEARLGQVPAALVSLKDGAAADEQALLDHLREQLLPYQIPTELRIVEALPRTVSMKVDLQRAKAMI